MLNLHQIENLHMNEPASDIHIKEAESQLNMVLPHVYKTLLNRQMGYPLVVSCCYTVLRTLWNAMKRGRSIIMQAAMWPLRRWGRASISHAAS